MWLTCLVFFQIVLLGGYLYAHWFGRVTQLPAHPYTRRPPWSGHLHRSLLLIAAVCSLAWSTGRLGSGHASIHPVANIFQTLALSIGLPFLLLSSTSPLLQLWLVRTTPGAALPYRLFALSNLASLLALGAYPTLIEPYLTLHHQRMLWCAGFVIFGVLSFVLLPRTSSSFGQLVRTSDDLPAVSVPSPSVRPTPVQLTPGTAGSTRLLWLLLPLGAGMQLSAVTSHLTENIAAIPLLWIMPLAVYLLTLIIAFEYPRLVPQALTVRLAALSLASLGYMLTKVDATLPIKISIPIYLGELFIACLFLHSAAYELRPRAASALTGFYLVFASGGALGSFLIGIAAPLLFSANYDLALSFLVTALLILAATWKAGWQQRLLWSVGSMLLLYLLILLNHALQHNRLVSIRNFYGSLRVEQKNMGPLGIVRLLTNGTIRHGTQIFSPGMSRVPTTYYAEDSGIGIALRYCCDHRAKRIGVVGLGVGTIAAYGQSGDTIRFYEINPAVPPIAQHLFSYLRDTPAAVSIVEGDARASLSKEAPENFNVLAVDAFSGDSIPLHLLTKEAMAIYLRHLATGGIIAFHVSNQYVDLEPQISLLAHESGMQARTIISAADEQRGEFAAEWVLITNDDNFLMNKHVILRLNKTAHKAGARIWTDDYSSLLPVLHW